MPVEGITSTNQNSVSGTDTSSSNQLSAEDFLKILAAELQYQDPTEGIDTTQYISQLAQLTSVQQLQTLNTSFSDMMLKQDLMLGSSWIGKEVAAYEKDDTISTGVVEGFMVTDAGIQVHVNGKQYLLSQIVAVSGLTESDAESDGSDEQTEPEE